MTNTESIETSRVDTPIPDSNPEEVVVSRCDRCHAAVVTATAAAFTLNYITQANPYLPEMVESKNMAIIENNLYQCGGNCVDLDVVAGLLLLTQSLSFEN